MDLEKIGFFIKQLREEKNLTQDELANILNVHRTTLNKWEKGHSLPLNDSLRFLSSYFKISVDEILSGERKKTKDDGVIYLLLNQHRKLKKILFSLIILLILFIILFLGYYFVSNYNSIYVYRISAESDNYEITDGIIILSKQKTYFKLGNIKSKNNEISIDTIELYTLGENDKKTIYQGDTTLLLIDNYNSQQYFDYNDIKSGIDIYLSICTKDNICEDLDLNLEKDFQNNNLFQKKKSSELEIIDKSNNNIPDYIINNFTYNGFENTYSLTDESENIFYIIDSNLLILKINDEKIEKTYMYNLTNEELNYTEIDNTSNSIIKDIIVDKNSNIYQEFYNKYMLKIFE